MAGYTSDDRCKVPAIEKGSDMVRLACVDIAFEYPGSEGVDVVL